MGTLLNETDESLRRVVARVALLNLAYFGVEFSVALAIGSVSLFADSIDFLEDTSVNFLILIVLEWSARRRSHVGMVFAGILLNGPTAAFGEGFHDWPRFEGRTVELAVMSAMRLYAPAANGALHRS